MPDIGKYYVQIVPSAEGISGGIQKAIAPQAAPAGVAAGRQIASNIGGIMQKLGGTMMKAGAIATAVSVPIIAGIKSALSAYEVQTAAETKLTEIYKTRMGVTEEAAKSTMKYASALQKEGVIGDEVMLSGAQQVATFAKMPETVNTLLPAMNNLLVQQKGYNATAQDATGIANLMGKALQGQTGALTRVGISFDEAQAKILKTGTEEEKAAVLAEVITENVGNMNETMAQTPLGKIQQMKNSFGDLQEELGAQLAPVLMQIADFISAKILPAISTALEFMSNNPIISQVVVGITGVLAIGGPLLALIGAITSSLGGVITALAGLASPVLAAIGIAAAVIAVFTAVYAKSETFRNAVNSLAKQLGAVFVPIMKTVGSAIKEVVTEVMALASDIGSALAPVINLLTPLLVFMAKIFAINLKVALKVAVAAIKTVSAAIRAAAAVVRGFATSLTPLVPKVKSVFNSVKNAITHPLETAKNIISGIVSKIKGFFNFHINAPHIPLPHFSVKPAGWKIGDLVKGKIPSLSVKWYAQGGIMKNGPTLFGGGENGDEAIVPLDPFWKKLDKIANSSGGDININVYGTEGQSPKAIAEEVKRVIIRETKQRRLAW